MMTSRRVAAERQPPPRHWAGYFAFAVPSFVLVCFGFFGFFAFLSIR